MSGRLDWGMRRFEISHSPEEWDAVAEVRSSRMAHPCRNGLNRFTFYCMIYGDSMVILYGDSIWWFLQRSVVIFFPWFVSCLHPFLIFCASRICMISDIHSETNIRKTLIKRNQARIFLKRNEGNVPAMLTNIKGGRGHPWPSMECPGGSDDHWRPWLQWLPNRGHGFVFQGKHISHLTHLTLHPVQGWNGMVRSSSIRWDYGDSVFHGRQNHVISCYKML